MEEICLNPRKWKNAAGFTRAWAGSAGFQTCRIADFQIGKSHNVAQPAGLETRDTADLEVCATVPGFNVVKKPMANRQPIDVSAALIFHKGLLLITQRHAGSHLGGLWEFPGGKREPNENFEQCLAREISEELGMTIAVGKLFDEITHAYEKKTVHLKFFLCKWTGGQPQALGCASFKWVARDELARYQFPAADAQLLEKISRHWPEGRSRKS